VTKPEKEISWKEIPIGAASIEPGNAMEYRTGDWRSMRPVWDKNRCVKCGVCFIFCPDAAIHKVEDDYFEADLFYCKGCGICARECITGAIKMVEEE